MVLQNKSLKELYNAEHTLYEASENKQDYEISNPVLDREIKKIKAYISNRSRKSVTIKKEESKKSSISWLWIIVFIVLSLFGKCMSSYYKGRALEENRQKALEEFRQKYLHEEYNNISINRPTIDIIHLFKPIFQ